MNETRAVLLDQFAVETESLIEAAKVVAALRKRKKSGVRGSIQVDGKKYRWTTLQQFLHHSGFNSASR